MVLNAAVASYTCMFINTVLMISNIPMSYAFTQNYNSHSQSINMIRQQNILSLSIVKSLKHTNTIVRMATTGEEKAAPLISGADLEVLLADLDTPLVLDAYATWYVFFSQGNNYVCLICLLLLSTFGYNYMDRFSLYFIFDTR
jgi:hypothetical protein